MLRKNICFVILIIVLLLYSGCFEDMTEYKYVTVSVDKDDRITISDIKWEFDEAKNKLIVTGSVKNVGTEDIKTVTIYSKAYNEDDVLISESQWVKWGLNAGDKIKWETIDYCYHETPTKVSVGYSYEVIVVVPPQKRIF